MNFSYPFIRRPVGTTLLAIGLFLVGAVAYVFLPVASLPTVDLPTIRVSASQPGADPETMAATVAAPLERRLGEIAGVTEITSLSTLGQTSITIQFDLNRNIDGAARDVQAAHQCRRHRPAERPAAAADVPQGQSGGGAGPHSRADLEDDPGERDLRCGRYGRGAAHHAGRRRRRRHGQRRRTAGHPRPRQSGAHGRDRHLARRRAHRDRQHQRAGTARRVQRRCQARRPSPPTTSYAPSPTINTSSSSPRTATSSSCPISPASCKATRNSQLRRLVQPAAGRAADRHQAGQRQRHRHGRPYPRAAAGDQTLDPGRHRHLGPVRPHRDHPRERARHAGDARRPQSCW